MNCILLICIFSTLVCGGFCGFCNQCFFNGNYSNGAIVNVNDERMAELARRVARLGIGFRLQQNKRMCLDALTHEQGESSGLGGDFGPSCVVIHFKYRNTEAIYRTTYKLGVQECVNNVKEKHQEYVSSVACCKPGLVDNLRKCRDGAIIRSGNVLGAASITASVILISLTSIIGLFYSYYSCW